MQKRPEIVQTAERVAAGEVGTPAPRKALAGLLEAYRKLESCYLYAIHEGRPPEPDPVKAPPVGGLFGGAPGQQREPAPDEEDGDRMLRVEEAAEILGVKKRWLYDRSDSLPFAKRLAPRTLRFSEHGLYEWLETRP